MIYLKNFADNNKLNYNNNLNYNNKLAIFENVIDHFQVITGCVCMCTVCVAVNLLAIRS